MQTDADSTIAITVYNLLAINRNPLDVTELLTGASAQHCSVEPVQLSRAAQALVERGWVGSNPDGTYFCKDSHRRVVIARDRSDAEATDDDGNCVGGWNGWQLRSMARSKSPVPQTVSIDQALTEQP